MNTPDFYVISVQTSRGREEEQMASPAGALAWVDEFRAQGASVVRVERNGVFISEDALIRAVELGDV